MGKFAVGGTVRREKQELAAAGFPVLVKILAAGHTTMEFQAA